MLKWTGALFLLAASAAGAQENIFSSNTANNTASVTDGQTFVPLPATGALGPNPFNTGANSAPRSMIYDPIRTKVYAVNTTGQTVVAIDPLLMTTKSVLAPGLAGPLSMASMSADGRYLYAAGGSTIAGKVGIFRYDLDDFTAGGVTFMGGLTPAGSTTYTPVDVEVLPGKAYFTYTSVFSGTLAITIFHIGEVDLATGVFTDLFAVNATSTTQPRAFTRMTRSPDSSFVLVAASTGSTVAPTAWQVPRINPAALPVVDVVTIPTGSANEMVEDFVFTTSGGAPFTVCMLARDDSSYSPRFLSIGATGAAGAVTNGPAVPSGFGGSMSPDLAHNRIFFAHNGSTAFPNSFEILSPATPAGAFQGANPPNSGAPGPQEVVVAPAPPRLRLDAVTQPAGIVAGPFQLEMLGSGFLQGSSRGRIIDPVGTTFFATSTQVINSGRLLANFAANTVTHYDVGVVNNDGQFQTFPGYFQGLPAAPKPGNLPLTIPSLSQGYRLLSFPEYATVGDLRAAVAAQLGPYNPIFFRIFVWQTDHYLELNNSKLPSSYSLMGSGVIAISRDGAALDLTAPDLSQNSTIFQRTVVLQSGWNIVSQPWINGPTNTLPYASLDVHLQDDLLDPAVAATVSPSVTNVLYEASGGVYVTSTVMTAGRAYWILNRTNNPLYLVIRQVAVNQKATQMSQATATSETPPPLPGGALGDSGGGGGGGCGLLGGEALLVLLFLRGRGRRKLAA